MKIFKIIDMWISISLIVVLTAISLIRMDYTYLIAYCIVGSWQIISMFIHSINKWFTQKGSIRDYYHWIAFIFLALLPVAFFFGFISKIFFILFCILLFSIPFMAIYYTWVCYNEIYVKMQRPLALLK